MKLRKVGVNMPHICMDEIWMLLSMFPFIGYFFHKVHAWYHLKFHHKCHSHEDTCHKNHVVHEDETPVPTEVAGYKLTLKGVVAATVLTYAPITFEEVVNKLPNEDSNSVISNIEICLNEGILSQDEQGLLYFDQISSTEALQSNEQNS